jgi:hypothetical protein
MRWWSLITRLVVVRIRMVHRIPVVKFDMKAFESLLGNVGREHDSVVTYVFNVPESTLHPVLLILYPFNRPSRTTSQPLPSAHSCPNTKLASTTFPPET